MKICPHCSEEIIGRADKKFCSPYCKSSYYYQENLKTEKSLFAKIDKQLKTNRRLLKSYNKAGKAVVPVQKLLAEGFNPNYFTNYWKNQKNDVYLFCYEFGFLKKREHAKSKYVLITWQDYMTNKNLL